MPLWLAGGPDARAPQFVDFQNDVAASDILLAAREALNPSSTSSAIRRWASARTRASSATSTAWPSWRRRWASPSPRPAPPPTGRTTPVSFGAFAGRELGEFLDPVRKTCLHEWHAGRGALFEDVGNWKRPWYYPLRARTCTPPCAGMPGGAQRRRHPGRVHAGQDRYPGARRGGLAELDVHQSLGQARDRQMPLWADARRERHGVRRWRHDSAGRASLHDDHHHGRRGACCPDGTLAADRMAAAESPAGLGDRSLGHLRGRRSEKPRGAAQGLRRYRFLERGVS